MVVRTTRGHSSTKVFDVRSGSMLGDLFRDYMGAMKLYHVDMGSVRESIGPILVYTALLSMQIFVFLWAAFFINKVGGKAMSLAMGMSLGAFCVMTAFFFGAGYIYREVLGKRIDTSYISYVYAVGLSVAYYPYFMLIAILLDGIWGFICMMALASVSQFLIRASLTRDHGFESNRDRFMFDITTFVLQCGFCFGSLSLFGTLSPIK